MIDALEVWCESRTLISDDEHTGEVGIPAGTQSSRECRAFEHGRLTNTIFLLKSDKSATHYGDERNGLASLAQDRYNVSFRGEIPPDITDRVSKAHADALARTFESKRDGGHKLAQNETTSRNTAA